MRPSGFILRFIDIGLLLLFGFLFISDMSIDTHIKLPGGDSKEIVDPKDQTLIAVTIIANNTFSITSSDGAVSGVSTDSIESLELALSDIKEAYADRHSDVMVLIQPDGASIIQTTVFVMDVCDRLELQKSLDTKYFQM